MMKFFKKTKEEPENFEDILTQFKELKKKTDEISEELEKIKKKNKFSIQKIGVVRFNPFREVGGDQSFSLAILDDNDSGAVITSHYTREGNRVYGKPIKAGASEYPLSEYEVSAIEKANNPDSKILSAGEIKKENRSSKKANGK
jgi:N-methylhydantoinase A/oxoprolinase/acetone carboxylase beta subunit